MRRKTDFEFKQEVKELVDDEYTVLDEYINSKTKIRFKHNKCNKIYYVTPINFKAGHRCPYCYGHLTKSLEDFKKILNDEYTVLDEYVNNKTKLRFKHNKCNNFFEMRMNDFQQGHRCPYCYGNNKKTTEIFKQEVKKLVGNEYTVLDEYVNNKTKLRFKHNKCNNIFEMKPNLFLQNYRCPYCNESKGEQRIRNWLSKNNIEFEREFKFKDCFYKNKKYPLRFDFKINFNNEIILLEYDGIQHFKDWFYGDLKDTKIKDNIKNNYCKNNNIKLIRISYLDFNNIESILTEIFN